MKIDDDRGVEYVEEWEEVRCECCGNACRTRTTGRRVNVYLPGGAIAASRQLSLTSDPIRTKADILAFVESQS